DRGRRGRTVRGRHGEGRRPVPEVEGPQGRPQDRPRDLDGGLGRAGDGMPFPHRHIGRAACVGVGGGVTDAGAGVCIRYEVGCSVSWVILLNMGGALAAAGWSVRSYKNELPGIIPAMGGLAISSILSWQAALGDSPGSGPRASIVTAVTLIALLRLAQLIRTSRDARWAAEVDAG